MARRSNTQIGPLSKNSEHVPHWTPPKQTFETPTRVTNASTTAAYSQKADWSNSAHRPGCLDFLRFRSRGFGC